MQPTNQDFLVNNYQQLAAFPDMSSSPTSISHVCQIVFWHELQNHTPVIVFGATIAAP